MILHHPLSSLTVGKNLLAHRVAPFFPAFIHKGTRVVPLDVWITADPTQTPNGTIKADDGIGYAAGFHAYSEEKQKPIKATCRVYLRRITSVGNQGGNNYPVVVAQEMYVPSKPDGWPPTEKS
jgi:hypothetical protein